MHATTAMQHAAERNWSAGGHPEARRNYTSLHNNLGKERAEKLVYVKAEMAAR